LVLSSTASITESLNTRPDEDIQVEQKMLTEQQIQDALHASRVVPLLVPNPHGPLGLEQLAGAVAQAAGSSSPEGRVERALGLPLKTWEKLDGLARNATKTGARRISASDVAAALIEQAVRAAS
jgi:hypothetical protein